MAIGIYDPEDDAAKKAAKNAPKASGNKGGSGKDKGKNSGKGGSGGSGGGGYDYAKEQKKAQSKAAERYRKQAESMQGQINAIRASLTTGFRKALAQRLANIQLVSSQQDAAVMEGYKTRVGSLSGAAKDNERAAGDQGYAALSNRGRERANALSEAMAQGAGETDALRTQMASLRNWNANQSEVNRSYFDTLRSVNSSLGDLNVDTKTARLNIESQANTDRDQVYSTYYDQRSQSLTQLGNLYGQQAEYYGMANEQVGSKKTRAKQRERTKASDRAFLNSSKENAKVYKNPGQSKALQQWKGEKDFEATLNNGGGINAGATATTIKRPEGASLRKW